VKCKCGEDIGVSFSFHHDRVFPEFFCKYCGYREPISYFEEHGNIPERGRVKWRRK